MWTISMASGKLSWLTLTASFIALFTTSFQDAAEQSQGAYFLPEFALSPQGSFLEDTTGEQFLTYRFDDQAIWPLCPFPCCPEEDPL